MAGRLDEEGGDVGGQDAEQGDAGHHQEGGDPPAGRGHREGIAVADRGDGGDRPPQGIAERVDAAAAVRFDDEHQGGGGDDGDAGDQDGVVELVAMEQPAARPVRARRGRPRAGRAGGLRKRLPSGNSCPQPRPSSPAL